MDLQSLTVALDGNSFKVEKDDNLLQALLSQGGDVRYGCCAGACGACRLYDLTTNSSILACQTSVVSNLSLSAQVPATSIGYAIESKNFLDDSNIEFTLLGPSDEGFGDRVFVSAFESQFVECMALNDLGAPLKVVLQKGTFSQAEWQKVVTLQVDDTIAVQTECGTRKGRLLYEMDLSDSHVLVVSSFENKVFEPYWRHALENLSSQEPESFCLPDRFSMLDESLDRSLEDSFDEILESSGEKTASCQQEQPLQDSVFLSLLQKLVAESGPTLQIIYHGQNLPEAAWLQILRPLRIRQTQLHFVR